jgi:hypothetical protein
LYADGVISQFDNYEELDELDWDRYRATYGNIGRLDLILEAEVDTTNRFKLAKQADVLVLIYLLGLGQLRLLAELGYRVTREALGRTIDYYLARTAHGSTLSRVAHASVLAQERPGPLLGHVPRRAGRRPRRHPGAAPHPRRHPPGRHGRHRGHRQPGLRRPAEARRPPRVDPHPSGALRRVRFETLYRGQRIDAALDAMHLCLAAHPCAAAPAVRIQVAGTEFTPCGGGQTLLVDHRTGAIAPAPPAADAATHHPSTER